MGTITAYIVAHWYGQLSLGRSYWINVVLVNVVLGGGIYQIGAAMRNVAPPSFMLGYLSLVVAISSPLAIWQFVGCWRSASKHQIDTKRNIFRWLVKLSLLVGAISGIENLGKVLQQGTELVKIVTKQDSFETYRVSLESGGTELVLVGYINYDSTREITNLIENNHGIEIVDLMSLGGRIVPAMELAQLIEARRLTTHARGDCVSACTLVFLAGTKRILNKDARLGFHQPSFPGLSALDLSRQLGDMRVFYLKHGLPEPFVDQALSRSGTLVWYPTQGELIKAGAITHLLNNGQLTAVH